MHVNKILQERLKKVSPFLEEIYNASILSFNQADNILRFNNCSTNFRELFRLFFDVIAPDINIKNSKWFIPDETSKTGVTRGHRVKYSIYKYISPENFQIDFSKEVDELSKRLLKKIDEFSKYTHLTINTVNLKESIATKIISEASEIFIELLDKIIEAKIVFKEYLESTIREELTDTLFLNTFSEIDELSSHTSVDGVSDIEFEIKDITIKSVIIQGSGNISCELQYGSESDQKNDMGWKTGDSYPFSFKGSVSTTSISQIFINPEDILIDTDKFFD